MHVGTAAATARVDGGGQVHDMAPRAVDEVDGNTHLVHAGETRPRALREAVRGLAVEVLGTVVREHPTPAQLREAIPRFVRGDEGFVGVAVLGVLEAGGLRESYVSQVEGNEREEVELPTGLEDGDRNLGDLREDVLRTETECRCPPHRLSDPHVGLAREHELDGAEKNVGTLGVGDEEGGKGRKTRRVEHEYTLG